MESLIPHDEDLVGFLGHSIAYLRYLKLRVTFGRHLLAKTIIVHSLDVSMISPFNMLIGRPTLNALGVVISNPHLVMKFVDDDLKVVTI